MRVPNWNKGWPNAGYHAPFELEGIKDEPGQYLTDRLTDYAEDFISENQDQPFFLYMSHFAVHDPIHGRPDLVEKYRQKVGIDGSTKFTCIFLGREPDDPQSLTNEQLASFIDLPLFQDYKVLPNEL